MDEQDGRGHERAVGRGRGRKLLRRIGGFALITLGVVVFTIGRLSADEFLADVAGGDFTRMIVIGLPSLVLVFVGTALMGWFRFGQREPVDERDSGQMRSESESE